MDKLGMSLDDMIKAKGKPQNIAKPKAASGRGAIKTIGKAGRGRGAGRGAAVPLVKPSPGGGRGVAAATLSSMAKATTLVSKSRAAVVAPVAGLTTGTKLRVGNLDLNVTQEDVQELFEASVHRRHRLPGVRAMLGERHPSCGEGAAPVSFLSFLPLPAELTRLHSSPVCRRLASASQWNCRPRQTAGQRAWPMWSTRGRRMR
jgi:hypothetical protein